MGKIFCISYELINIIIFIIGYPLFVLLLLSIIWIQRNKENASKLWKIIQEAGDYLEGQLPDHPNHPKGRNPYAHVAICVKNKFNASYKDIPDEKFE